jgi:nucleoid DNA-binding protein
MAKAPAAPANKKPKAPSKSEVLGNIAEATNLSKKDVSAVLEALSQEIEKAVGKKGPGAVTIPGLVKITRKHVPARAAQKNVPNRFKPGEFVDRPAKPAYFKVGVRALKSLKSMV